MTRSAILLAASCLAACIGAPDDGTMDFEEETAALDGTVGAHVRSGCSTAPVLGLSRQVADEITCMQPDALVSFSEGGGIVFVGSAVLPYLTPDARDALVEAGSRGRIEITSAFRTLPQQYLLRKWYDARRCGITAAAQPGRSNHESGRAIDVANRSSARSRLRGQGWYDDVPGDAVHFDHTASDDIRGLDVLAFQRLWNRNHPEDLIAEDGDYGNQTATRLYSAPAAGFPIGAGCGDDPVARTVWVDDASGAFSTSGRWTPSTNVSGYFQSGYHVLAAGRTGSATWTPSLEAAGDYEVTVVFPAARDRSPAALFRVCESDDAEPLDVWVDERANGTVVLGTFHLERSATIVLEVASPAAGATIADAVKLVPT